MQTEILKNLQYILGEKGFLSGTDVHSGYHTDSRGIGEVKPEVVLRPASTEDLSQIMSICHAASQPVVVQGGLTGLVLGARPQHGEIVITFERMNKVENIDVNAGIITVQAGAPLQIVQETAEAHDMTYPLDLGSRGSCNIGGNLATNAGGIRHDATSCCDVITTTTNIIITCSI